MWCLRMIIGCAGATGRVLLPVTMAACWMWAASGRADVIVLTNQTRDAVTFQVVGTKARGDAMTLPTNELTVLSLRGPCEVTFGPQPAAASYRLDANAVYTFVNNDRGQVDLEQLDLGGTEETAGGRALETRGPTQSIAEISVELLVDNYEPTLPDVWESRLRKRIERISTILEHYCRVRLKVVSVDQWTTSPESVEFPQALAEFQRRVTPQPGRVAIGFTGRYQDAPGRLHLGVTTGMLETHILVREWSKTMSEPEREEVLLHEVGHFLGAVHSPDRLSVMRPLLADNQAIRTTFRIGFDPVNTLLINLVAEEIRMRRATSVHELSAATRLRLSQIYAKLADTVPGDKSARQYHFQMGLAGDTPLANATRGVVSAVRTAALEHAARGGVLREDRLTEYYVRYAAKTAAGLPHDVAPAALLLGLGIGLDESATLLDNRLTGAFSRVVESESEREQRGKALASPTLLGRRDLARHFFLSAYLTAIIGAPAAESAGLAKELADATGGNGFSFPDLAADLAGISFAERVLRREVPLEQLAERFEVARFMPTIEDLPEGLAWSDLAPRMQGEDAQTFAGYRKTILDRILKLRSAPPAPNGGG